MLTIVVYMITQKLRMFDTQCLQQSNFKHKNTIYKK